LTAGEEPDSQSRQEGRLLPVIANVIGNGIGVRLEGATTTATLAGNTFAGNRGNCGVQNNTGTTIQATGNYWRAPTGPGPDPADASCVFNPGSATVTAPFLTSDPSKPQAALR
jgi:hypothetical protein